MALLGRILVIGATGNVGRQVVAQAVAAGPEVRAMVRDPAKATFPPGVDLDLGEQGNPILEFHAALERTVVATGLGWVCLRPFSFASNNLEWVDQVRTGLVRAAGGTEVRSLIHEADIGAVAVQALTGDALVGTPPQLSGPEALTTAEQALALGMPVRFEEISQEEAWAHALAAGCPADLVEALFDGAGDFMPQPVTGAVEEITGHVPRSVRRGAFDHAEACR